MVDKLTVAVLSRDKSNRVEGSQGTVPSFLHHCLDSSFRILCPRDSTTSPLHCLSLYVSRGPSFLHPRSCTWGSPNSPLPATGCSFCIVPDQKLSRSFVPAFNKLLYGRVILERPIKERSGVNFLMNQWFNLGKRAWNFSRFRVNGNVSVSPANIVHDRNLCGILFELPTEDPSTPM